jgi:L-amino acid N-acyltransferase YncA
MNIKETARDIRERREQLDTAFPNGYLYICTIDNRERAVKGGAVSEVSSSVAAKHIVERTGRVATDAEIEDLHKRHAATRQLLQRQQAALAPRPLSVSVDKR